MEPSDASSYVESVAIEMRAIARMTERGFGVAIAHPFEEAGVIAWFANPSAFVEAQREAKHGIQALDVRSIVRNNLNGHFVDERGPEQVIATR